MSFYSDAAPVTDACYDGVQFMPTDHAQCVHEEMATSDDFGAFADN